MHIFTKVKKYLLLISVFFTLAISSHLVYVYFYDGASKFPVVGWSISVWFIGDIPSLNPLEFSLNPANDYMLQFLYKSLLKYDSQSKRMEWNLANCDLGKDFSRIKCYIKTWNYWSDGSPITKDDVIATYNAIKESDINKPLKKMLESIDINDKGDYIEFSSNNADVLLLDSFAMPIVNKTQIDSFLSWKWVNNYITSGSYVFWNKELDPKLNIKKITVFRREWGWIKDIYISKYVFKFFADENAMMKNEDTLNIIYSESSLKKMIVSPRFYEYKYILPQYVWMFINSEKISNTDLRKIISFQLENANFADIFDEKDWKIINNPFFTDEKISPELKNKNMGKLFNDLGYFKKEYLMTQVGKKFDDQMQPVKTNTWIPSSTYFLTPTRSKISFISNTNEILLSWNVPTWTESVYINDYKLNSFVTWNTKFYFRAKKDFGTLKQGVNYFALSTQVWDKKMRRETITVYYYDKQEDLDKKKQEVLDNLAKVKEVWAKEKNKIEWDKQNEIAKINNLESIYYYDKNLNKFKLTLEYAWNWPIFQKLAEKIKAELKILWIEVELKQDDQKAMEDVVNKWNKNYDLMLTWINHWLFYYNIAPFFHSWQAKSWFNFSKIKNVSLDVLLEKLKSSTLSEEKLSSIEKESLSVLKEESVVKTFYSPYSVFYVDKNLKNINTVWMLPYSYYTYKIVENSYIKEDFVVDFTKKSFKWLMSWLLSKI